jgi:hypothetical protein
MPGTNNHPVSHLTSSLEDRPAPAFQVQGYLGHEYKVARSTISRMMAEIRLKEELKGRLL